MKAQQNEGQGVPGYDKQARPQNEGTTDPPQCGPYQQRALEGAEGCSTWPEEAEHGVEQLWAAAKEKDMVQTTAAAYAADHKLHNTTAASKPPGSLCSTAAHTTAQNTTAIDASALVIVTTSSSSNSSLDGGCKALLGSLQA